MQVSYKIFLNIVIFILLIQSGISCAASNTPGSNTAATQGQRRDGIRKKLTEKEKRRLMHIKKVKRNKKAH